MPWYALPPGLTTEAAAPGPRPLVLQALGMQVHGPPGAKCLHQKWIPLKLLFSGCSFPEQGFYVRISLVGLGNMWGPVSKSRDPMSSGYVRLTWLEFPRHPKSVQICCEARKCNMSNRDRIQINLDSGHLWRVESEERLKLELCDRILGMSITLGWNLQHGNSDSMRFSHYSYAVTNVAINFSCSDLLCCHYSTFLCWCIKPLLHICWHLIYLRETSDYPLPRRLIRSVQAKTAELLLEDNKWLVLYFRLNRKLPHCLKKNYLLSPI